MVQVVIQPSYGNAAAHRHWADTLEREVDFTTHGLSGVLTGAQRQDLAQMHPGGSARFWGTVAFHDRRMDTLAAGDVVLFTGRKHVQAVGEVGVSFRNAAAADALWQPDPDRGSYHNVYSLRSFQATQIPYEEIWALPGFNAGDNFLGTRFLDEDRSLEVLEGLAIDTTTSREASVRRERAVERILAGQAPGTLIPGEALNVTDTEYVTGARTTLVHRGEALLVRAYTTHLGLDHERVATPVGLTDAFLPSPTGGRDLVEAKSSNNRRHVREAVGQLLDYAPHCPDVRSLTVLLPERPDPQMLAYAHRYGIDIVHRMPDGRFRRDAAPATARAAILGLISPGPVHPALQRDHALVQATYPQRPSAEPGVTASVAAREAARTRGTALER